MNSFPHLFQLLELHSLHSLAHGPFLVFKAHRTACSNLSLLPSSHYLLFCSLLSLCFLLKRTLVMTSSGSPGHSRIIFSSPDHQFNYVCKLFPSYSQSPWIRMWTEATVCSFCQCLWFCTACCYSSYTE